MIKLLEQAIAKVRTLPPERQEEAALFLLNYADGGEVYVLTPEERADLDEAEAEVARGEVATDEEVRAFWAQHGL